MRYGLTEQTIQQINSVFEKHPVVKQAVLYGSRAKGNYKPGSDIDLSLFGEDISQREVNQILDELDALDLPYTIDMTVFRDITHAKFRDHIARVGVVFYQRGILGHSECTNEDRGQGSCASVEKCQNDPVDQCWNTKGIGEVADIFDGPHATPKTVDTGPIFLGIGALNDGMINLRETRHVTENDFKTWTRRVRPQAGDVVFSYETRLGQAAIIPDNIDCCLGRRMGLVRFKTNEVIPKFFLYQYISPSYRNFLDSKTIRGATVDRISIKEFPFFPIAIPSIEEQKRIVSILDDAFECIDTAIANTEKNIANARELFESYLDRVFAEKGDGWEEKNLEDILSFQPRNGWSPPASHHSDRGTPVLTLSSVTGFQFKKEALKYTSAQVNPKAHYWVENGDLLMTRSNTPELVGHVAVCDGVSANTIYPDLIMKMKVDKHIALTEFVYFQLRSSKLRNIIKDGATGANPTMKK